MEKYIFKQLDNKPNIEQQKNNIDLLKDVDIRIDAIIGSTNLKISELQQMHSGTLIPLNKDVANLTIDLLVENKKIATGEIVTDGDDAYIKIIGSVTPKR